MYGMTTISAMCLSIKGLTFLLHHILSECIGITSQVAKSGGLLYMIINTPNGLSNHKQTSKSDLWTFKNRQKTETQVYVVWIILFVSQNRVLGQTLVWMTVDQSCHPFRDRDSSSTDILTTAISSTAVSSTKLFHRPIRFIDQAIRSTALVYT